MLIPGIVWSEALINTLDGRILIDKGEGTRWHSTFKKNFIRSCPPPGRRLIRSSAHGQLDLLKICQTAGIRLGWVLI
tara:strand:+ start:403 stop:633 length:231 start_codon:yes stop_codon:yes gene_type:complete